MSQALLWWMNFSRNLSLWWCKNRLFFMDKILLNSTTFFDHFPIPFPRGFSWFLRYSKDYFAIPACSLRRDTFVEILEGIQWEYENSKTRKFVLNSFISLKYIQRIFLEWFWMMIDPKLDPFPQKKYFGILLTDFGNFLYFHPNPRWAQNYHLMLQRRLSWRN